MATVFRPPYTQDGELDSWANAVTQEVNRLGGRISRGPRLPAVRTANFGDEFYLSEVDGTNAVGWYKFVDNDIGWVAL